MEVPRCEICGVGLDKGPDGWFGSEDGRFYHIECVMKEEKPEPEESQLFKQKVVPHGEIPKGPRKIRGWIDEYSWP